MGTLRATVGFARLDGIEDDGVGWVGDDDVDGWQAREWYRK
jgi:hypothetical protein